MIAKVYENSLYEVYHDNLYGVGYIHSVKHNDDTLWITGFDMEDLIEVVTQPLIDDDIANSYIEEHHLNF